MFLNIKNMHNVLLTPFAIAQWLLFAFCLAAGTCANASPQPEDCAATQAPDASARCILDNYHLDENAYILQQISREALQKRVIMASTDLAPFQQSSPLALAKIRFLAAMAYDPDNYPYGTSPEVADDDFQIALKHYQSVCEIHAPTSPDADVAEQVSLLCSVARFRVGMVSSENANEKDYQKELNAILSYVKQQTPDKESAEPNYPDWIIHRAIILVLSTLAFNHSDNDYTAASGYALLILKTAVQPAEAPPDFATLSLALNIGDYISLSRELGAPRTQQNIDIVRNVHTLATTHFSADTPAFRKATALLADLDIDIARSGAFSSSKRNQALEEANQQTELLYRNIQTINSPAERNEQLSVVQPLFEALRNRQRLYEVLIERYALSKKAMSPAQALPLQADLAHNLALMQEYRSQAEGLALGLVDGLNSAPQETANIGSAYYDTVETLYTVSDTLPPCQLFQRLQTLQALSLKGQKISHDHILTAGMADGLFDLQLKTLNEALAQSAEQHPECAKTKNAIDPDAVLKKQINALMAEISQTPDRDTLREATVRFMVLNGRIDKTGEAVLLDPARAGLLSLAAQYMQAVESATANNPLRFTKTWKSFVKEEVDFLYGSGKIDAAFERIKSHQQEMAAHRASLDPGVLTDADALWPRTLRRDGYPKREDDYVYSLLSRALVKQGQILAAIAWLPMLSQNDASHTRQAIFETLAKRPASPEEQTWLDSLTSAEKAEMPQSGQEKRPSGMTIETWIAADPGNISRLNEAMTELAHEGKFQDIVSVARTSNHSAARSHAVDLLINDDRINIASELESDDLYADTFISLKAAQAAASPDKAQQILSEGLVRLPDLKNTFGGIDTAASLLCAASQVQDIPWKASFARHFIALMKPTDSEDQRNNGRKQFGRCLVKIGLTTDGFTLLQQISRPTLRMTTLTSLAIDLAEQHNAGSATTALTLAQTTFDGLKRFDKSAMARDLYYAWAKIFDVNKAESEAGKLVYAPTDKDGPLDKERKLQDVKTLTPGDLETYRNALKGLLAVSLENHNGDYIAKILGEKQPTLGDVAIVDIAMTLLDNLARVNKADTQTALTLLKLVLSSSRAQWNRTEMVDFFEYLGAFESKADALTLIDEMTLPEDKARALATLVAAGRDAGRCPLAEDALQYARQIPWRKTRIRTLAFVADRTAGVSDCEASRHTVDEITAAMKGPGEPEAQVQLAWTRLLSRLSAEQPLREIESQIDALSDFGKYYQNGGYQSQVAEILHLTDRFDAVPAVQEDLAALRADLKEEFQVPAMLASELENWRQLATRHPQQVIKEIEQASVYNYADYGIDTGLAAYQLAFELSQSQGPDTQLALRVDYAGIPGIPPAIVNHYLWLLERKRQKNPAQQQAISQQAIDAMLTAQGSSAGAALVESLSRQQHPGAYQDAIRTTEQAARRWTQLQNQMVQQLATSTKADISDQASEAATMRNYVEQRGDVIELRDTLLQQTLRDNTKNAAQIQRGLREDEAFLIYRMGDDTLYLGVITPKAMTFYELDESGYTSQKINRLAERIIMPLQSEAGLKFDYEAAYRLYDAVLKPAEPALQGVKHLIIVPDKALLSVPFQILLREPTEVINDTLKMNKQAPWLVRDFSIEVLPSVTAFSLPERADPPASSSFIAFANPAFARWRSPECDGPFAVRATGARRVSQALIPGPLARYPSDSTPPLPDTSCLVRTVSQHFPADSRQLFEGPAVTEERVKQLSADGTLAKYQIVMFATHGVMGGEGIIREPGIVLSTPVGNDKEDGYLAVSEILSLSFNAQLVVLSACNSAAGNGLNGAGEAMGGLTSAFIYAGARHLYVTHWPLDAQAGSFLFSRIFEQPSDGERSGRYYAQALRRAELEMLAAANKPEETAPRMWGAVSSVGQ